MVTSLCGLGLGVLVAIVVVFVGFFQLHAGIFLIAIVLGGSVVGGVQVPLLNIQRSIVSSESWVLASVFGCSLAVGSVFAVAWVALQLPIHTNTALSTLIGYLIGPASGLVLGMFQWMLLRRTIDRAASWILTTMVSSGIVWVIVIVLASYAFGGSGD
jgi:hypothetical protein